MNEDIRKKAYSFGRAVRRLEFKKGKASELQAVRAEWWEFTKSLDEESRRGAYRAYNDGYVSPGR